MMGKRRAALVRMQRVIERAKAKQAVTAKSPIRQEIARLDEARIRRWISDRLVADWRSTCWRCRKPFVVGQKFVDVRGNEVTVRLHQPCYAEWLAQQEALARQALGLDRSERE
jgi:hypothetical protein